MADDESVAGREGRKRSPADSDEGQIVQRRIALVAMISGLARVVVDLVDLLLGR